MHIAPGVHDLALTFDRGDRELTVHPAAVETPRGLLLVDVGMDREVLAEGLAAHGLALEDVTAVLCTHHDGDHVAALGDVVEATEATVLAHARAAPYIDGREAPLKGERAGEPAPVDISLQDGVSVRTAAGPMDVVFTPGHTPGHVSLHFPEHDALLAADAVVAADGEVAGPNPEFTPDMERARESVGRLAELGVERVLCYHGGPVRTDEDVLARVATAEE